jgi:hypothetical protein
MRYVTTAKYRNVLLIGRYAIKIPKLSHWVLGMIENILDHYPPHSDKPKPGAWCSRGGWLLIMRRRT